LGTTPGSQPSLVRDASERAGGERGYPQETTIAAIWKMATTRKRQEVIVNTILGTVVLLAVSLLVPAAAG